MGVNLQPVLFWTKPHFMVEWMHQSLGWKPTLKMVSEAFWSQLQWHEKENFDRMKNLWFGIKESKAMTKMKRISVFSHSSKSLTSNTTHQNSAAEHLINERTLVTIDTFATALCTTVWITARFLGNLVSWKKNWFLLVAAHVKTKSESSKIFEL